MLRMMRAPDGRPAFGVRVLAALVALGLLLITAPLLVPVLAWLIDAVM
jgi:hypothetical protein